MLNNKEKNFLKSYAGKNQILKINIGKDLITDTALTNISNALNKYELVKINFLKTVIESVEMEELILDLCSNLHCDLVSKIGHVILIYKENIKSPKHIVIK